MKPEIQKLFDRATILLTAAQNDLRGITTRRHLARAAREARYAADLIDEAAQEIAR